MGQSGSSNYSHNMGYNTDMNHSDLRSLYNTPVKTAELVQRPKQNLPNCVPNTYVTTHSGVRVTLDDGKNSQFLIHKGPGFGQASETVVTDAVHMSNKWEVRNTQDFAGSKTVGDFVKTGGENYSITKGQHCHRAAEDMMNQGK